MKPVIALVGRPNVGKSTLFNRLTRRRDALVDDQPGVTRDRLYGEGRIGERDYLVVDTGGLQTNAQGLEVQVGNQVRQVIEEAAAVIFVVDGQNGLTPEDQEIALLLRKSELSLVVAVNKSEGQQRELVEAEFQGLGLGQPVAVSAKRGDGVTGLMDWVLRHLPDEASVVEFPQEGPRIAIIGRPNVGKSTLINSLCHAQRVIVYDMPGTTRDSVRVPLRWRDQNYLLLDTAGVRRRARVTEALEKFSIVKTIQALEDSNVAVLMLDAQQGITDQDAALAGQIEQAGRAMVLAVNKWDNLEAEQRKRVWREMDVKMPFLSAYDTVTISAKRGSGLGELMDAIDTAYRSAMHEFSTGVLNRQLQAAITANAPPLHRGRSIKLKYAHQGGRNPPTIVVHGNQVDALSASYRRYLSNYFRKMYSLRGTRVRIELRGNVNPYQRK